MKGSLFLGDANRPRRAGAQEPAGLFLRHPLSLVLSTARTHQVPSLGFCLRGLSLLGWCTPGLPPGRAWGRARDGGLHPELPGCGTGGPASGQGMGWGLPWHELAANGLPASPASETGGVWAAEDRRGAEGPVHSQPHQAGQVSRVGVPGGGTSPAGHPPPTAWKRLSCWKGLPAHSALCCSVLIVSFLLGESVGEPRQPAAATPMGLPCCGRHWAGLGAARGLGR